jgi:hypothetical protein
MEMLTSTGSLRKEATPMNKLGKSSCLDRNKCKEEVLEEGSTVLIESQPETLTDCPGWSILTRDTYQSLTVEPHIDLQSPNKIEIAFTLKDHPILWLFQLRSLIFLPNLLQGMIRLTTSK